MSEMLVNILYSVSFLLSFVLIVVLWWRTARHHKARLFWGLLASGWTINTLASLLWGVFPEGGAIFYLIDGSYIARYVFVGLALWYYPIRFSPRDLGGILITILAAFVLLWFAFIGPLQMRTGEPVLVILQGAIFPLLDAGLIYLAWARWQNAQGGSLYETMRWLALSALAYGIANWANFWVRSITPDGDSLLVMLFWLLTDVFAFIAAWRFGKVAGAEPAGKTLS